MIVTDVSCYISWRGVPAQEKEHIIRHECINFHKLPTTIIEISKAWVTHKRERAAGDGGGDMGMQPDSTTARDLLVMWISAQRWMLQFMIKKI